MRLKRCLEKPNVTAESDSCGKCVFLWQHILGVWQWVWAHFHVLWIIVVCLWYVVCIIQYVMCLVRICVFVTSLWISPSGSPTHPIILKATWLLQHTLSYWVFAVTGDRREGSRCCHDDALNAQQVQMKMILSLSYEIFYFSVHVWVCLCEWICNHFIVTKRKCVCCLPNKHNHMWSVNMWRQ